MDDDVYTERARLVAFLSTVMPSIIAYNDPNAPDWAILYIDSPVGQMSWHIAPRDMHLFSHVNIVAPHVIEWDGHTTKEKYERLEKLITNIEWAWKVRNEPSGREDSSKT